MDIDFHFTCLNTSGMAGLYGKCTPDFIRDCQTVFRNGCTILHSYQQCRGVPENSRYYRFLFCCCSVAKLCLALCDPMNCSTPGFPAFHYFYLLVLLSTKREYLRPRIEYCNYFLFLLSVLCFCFTVFWTFEIRCICIEERFVFMSWSSHDDEPLFAQVPKSALSAEKAMPAFLFKN